MWKKILFAIRDPFDTDNEPLAKVADLAAAAGAELDLFHVAFSPVIADANLPQRAAAATIRDQVRTARAALEALASPYRSRGTVVHTSVRWDRPAYEGIIRQVLRSKPDLLAIDAQQRGALGRLLVRHTDFRLIELSPVPTLLMKSARNLRESSIVAAVDPEHSHDKPAQLDSDILAQAAFFEKILDASTTVVHVRRPATDYVVGFDGQPVRVPADDKSSELNRQRVKTKLRELADAAGLPAAHIQIESGAADQVLSEIVNRLRVGLVIMGAVSRSALKRAFLGHTAERVLDQIDADILVVKPRQFKTSVPATSRHLVRAAAPL
ncbi:MAG: universal stress protein [Steroidobacteraceae bacterium]